MKRYITLIFIALASIATGQNLPQSAFFVYDQMTINPGYAGSQEGICVNVLARNQWLGFEGSPTTQKFDIHTPFKLLGLEHGVGFALFNDEAGFQNDINTTLSYAFMKDVGMGKIGVGIGASLYNQTLSGSWSSGTDSDPLIPTESGTGKLNVDANIGVFYRTSNVYLGVSLVNLLQSNFAQKTNDGEKVYSHLARQFHISGGYNYQLANPLFEFQPALLISSNGASTQINVNATMRYKDKVWGGLGYRHTDAISTYVGAEIMDGINIGISYDITTSRIARFDDGSVEFFVRYVFKIGVEKEYNNYRSIRFL